MGRMDRSHLSRLMISAMYCRGCIQSAIVSTHAHLDVLSTINKSSSPLQHSSSGALVVSSLTHTE